MIGVANTKVALLLLGLLIGAVAGWLTRPQAAAFSIGGTAVEIVNTQNLAARSDPTTAGQGQHILLYTLAGGVIGLLAGFAVDRRR